MRRDASRVLKQAREVEQIAVLAHVRVDARGEVVVDGAELVDGDAVLLHDRDGDVDQPLRVCCLRSGWQRRVQRSTALRALPGPP